MLSKLGSLKGYKLNAFDGEVGDVAGFLFDDQHWTVRYVVADTGSWLTGKQILISPYAIGRHIHHGKILSVELTKKQIQRGSSLDANKPVSREFEESYYTYYGWPMYWDGPHLWGEQPELNRERKKRKNVEAGTRARNPHLRSYQEVSSYRVHALDGPVGQVDDFLVEDETWAIRYLIVSTQDWWPGRKILVSTRWVERVSWSESTIHFNLSREAVKQAPEYRDEMLLSREDEEQLHQHYHRKTYWSEEAATV